jgi:hypothetical protein
MMTKRFALVGVLAMGLFLTFSRSVAQPPPLTARIIISPVISSYISDWERDPNQIRLSVVNISQNTLQVAFEVNVTGRKTGLTVTSPRKAGTLRPGGNVFFPKDIIDFQNVKFNQGEGKNVKISRRLPDDDWELCVRINIQNAEASISTCGNFTLQFAVPPILINPADGERITTRFPLFQWTPATVKPGIMVLYRIKICELFAGQAARQALDANLPHFKQDGLPVTTFVYPVAGFPFNNKTQYVWQVQAYDEFGNALGDNDGKSEIWTFYYEEMK